MHRRELIWLLLPSLIAGCTTMKLPNYQAQAPAAYRQHEQKNGLLVGIRPMTDKAECEQYFGTDLARDYVLPVFVTIENTTDSSSFILQSERAGLRVGGVHKTADRDEVGSTGTGEALGWTSTGLMLASPALAIPALLAAGKQLSNATVIKHNFEVNELRSTTLGPRGKAHGFLYFPLPKDRDANLSGVVQIELEETVTRIPTRFEFPLVTQ